MTTYEKERYLISLYGYADFVNRIVYWQSQYSYSHDKAVDKLYEYAEFLKHQVWEVILNVDERI